MTLHLKVRKNDNFARFAPYQPARIGRVEVSPFFARKQIFMRGLGAVLLVSFCPVILLCMLLVRLTSRGPALFRQVRVGKDGKPFDVLKIRTMYADAEELSGPMLCQPGDSRITPVGRLLRFLHLDELPQLVNVVRGEMCLVGPRPERPEIIAKNRLREKVPGFGERTKVLPGVTGLAQINLPSDLTIECVVPKVNLDLEYISTATFMLDARILLCTALRMAGIRHGHAVRALGLSRKVSMVQPAYLQLSAAAVPSIANFRPIEVPGPEVVGAFSAMIGDEAAAYAPAAWGEFDSPKWQETIAEDGWAENPRRPR